MTSFGSTRLAKFAALCTGPVALLSVMAPSSANEPVDPSVFAPRASASDTGELESKGLSATTVLTSSSDKKITLAVYASGGEGNSVTVSLSRGGEHHSWNYGAGANDLQIGSTGAGSLSLTSEQTGDRGQLDLTFSPIEPAKTQKCGGEVAYKSRAMKVTGIAQAKTGTKSWGTVGSAKKAITFKGTSRVYWSYDVSCPSSPWKCEKATSWSASHSTASEWTYVSGRVSGKSSTISGYRNVQLNTPEGASRSDWVSRSGAPPKLTVTGDTASLTAEGTTGSIAISGSDPNTNSYTCRAGKTKATQKSTSWYGTATNGSKAFTVKAQIYGAFKVPNGAFGSISRYTY